MTYRPIYDHRPYQNDTKLSQLATYFDHYGTPEDRITTYYLLGIVLKEKHDAPQAIKALLTAADIGENETSPVDTFMLSYVYSNISELNADIKEPDQALKSGLRSLELVEKAGRPGIYNYINVAWAYRLKNRNDSASIYYRKAMNQIAKRHSEEEHANVIADQMVFFLMQHDLKAARACLSLLNKVSDSKKPDNYDLAMANYYDEIGQNDSLIYYASLAAQSDNYYAKSDAARLLCNAYATCHQTDKALEAARLYMQASDSIDEQYQRDNLINNQSNFNYQKNVARELANAQADVRLYRMLLALSTISLALVITFAAFLRRQRNKHKQLLSRFYQEKLKTRQLQEDRETTTEALQKLKQENEEQMRRQKQLTHELNEAQLQVAELAQENEQTRNELNTLKQKSEALVQEREVLRKQFNAAIAALDGLDINTDQTIKQFQEAASKGRAVKDNELWTKLVAATKNSKPGIFAEWMNREDINAEKLRVLCLYTAGFNNTEIERLMGYSHTTAWRMLTACGIVKKRN